MFNIRRSLMGLRDTQPVSSNLNPESPDVRNDKLAISSNEDRLNTETAYLLHSPNNEQHLSRSTAQYNQWPVRTEHT